jgi:sugar/nucleoside kinase (ribokinase family)/fructoselysine-6-P-deglycase FrlB-like protein
VAPGIPRARRHRSSRTQSGAGRNDITAPQSTSGLVVVIGNLTIDDVVRPDGSTAMASLGGNCVHTATAALVNGAEAAIVARKGEDFPDEALQQLASAGVDLTSVTAISGPTVRNWVVYESDGRRHWLYRTEPGRSQEVAPGPDDLAIGLVARAAVVHIAAMPLPNAELLVQAVRAQRSDVIVTLDTHEDWVDGYQDRLLQLAGLVDVFVPSIEELALLTGLADAAAGCGVLAARGLQRAVVKAGAAGAYVLDGGRVTRVPAPEVDVQDTTGAGDAFCGGLAAGLAVGKPLLDAVRIGCVTAAAAITASGSLRLLNQPLRADDLRVQAEALAIADRDVVDLSAVHAPAVGADAHDIDVMRREILTIPDVISGAIGDPGGHIEALAASLRDTGVRHLWLTGCGDSAFAGHAAALAFQRWSGLTPHPVHALDLARYGVRYLPPASAVIALSFSGKVGRTTEAAIQARHFGHRVIALTNNPDGQLAAASDEVLPIDVPTLGFSPGTSTYVGMLTTLTRLAAALGASTGDDALLQGLQQMPDLAAKTLVECAGPAEAAASALLSASWAAFLGAGPSEASAKFGAAKLFEGAQRIGLSTNVEEWAHEEYFVTSAGDPVVLIAPSGAGHDRAMEILAELRFIGARAIVVSDIDPGPGALHVPIAPGADEALSPLLTCLPLAVIGFHLARLAGKKSYNFASDEARDEHYDTIHRATIGEPA